MATTPQLAKKAFVIGKIPGYNQQIDPDTIYAKRLIDKMTIVDLEPIAIKVNQGIVDQLTSKTTKISIGQLNGAITSIPVWDDFNRVMSLHQEYLQTYNPGAKYGAIRLIATADSAINNAYSHTYAESPIDGILTSMWATIKNSDNFMGKTASVIDMATKAQMIYKAYSGNQYSASASSSLMEIANALSNYRVKFPRLWDGTMTTDILNLNIKLTSPSGEPEAIERYIIEPIIILFIMSAPLSHTGMDFGVPFTYRLKAPGIADYDLAAINNISLDRGGPDVVYNRYGQPLTVNVRLSLLPLSTDAAVALSAEAKQAYNTAWYHTPKKLYESFQSVQQFKEK